MVHGQELTPFIHLNEESGLTHNSITALHRDQHGFLWIGTADGLNRYDGQQVRQYWSGLPSNFVTDIYSDPDGHVWVATHYGVSLYDARGDRFKTVYTSESGKQLGVSTFGRGEIGPLYVCTNSALYRLDAKASNPIQLVRENIELFGRNGDMIVDHKDSLFYRKLGNVDSTYISDPRIAECNKFCPKSSLCYGYNGLYELVGGKMGSEVIDGFEGRIVESALIFGGEVWIGTNEGLMVEDHTQPGGWQRYFPGTRIGALHADSEFIFWIGTAGNGVLAIHPRYWNFKFNRLAPRSSNIAPVVWSITETEDGIASGTSDGLYQDGVDPDQPLFTGENLTTMLRQAPWTIYGTFDGVVASHDDGTEVRYQPGLPGGLDNVMLNGLALSDSTFLISSKKGLHRFYPSTREWKSYHNQGLGQRGGYANFLFQDSKETIWFCGTDGLSTYSLDMVLQEYIPTGDIRLPHGIITHGWESSNGSYWFATLGGGIFARLNTGEWKSFGKAEGLHNENVYGLLPEDSEDALWMSTNDGLSRFDLQTYRFQNFPMGAGSPVREYNQNAFAKDSDGIMYFGGIGGYVSFDPNDIREDNIRPKVALTNWRINNLSTDSVLAGLEGPQAKPGRVDLWEDDRIVSFDLAALRLAYLPLFDYEYQLSNHDQNWVTLDLSRPVISFSNVEYGEHEFKIRARRRSDNTTEEMLSFPIERHPPVWKTWWFRLLALVALFTSIGVAIWRIYVVRLRRRLAAAELQNKVHEERTRISRDLHDNIGSQLTFIISSLDNHAHMQKDERNKGRLNDLSGFTRNTMNELRETIWTMNKEAVSTDAFAQKLAEYLTKSGQASPDISFDFDQRGDHHGQLNAAETLHGFRMVQEAVNNAIKYANARCIKVEVDHSQALAIQITITDDGDGFDPTTVIRGNGLNNLEERAIEAKGSCVIESAPGKGTSVLIKLPIEDALN